MTNRTIEEIKTALTAAEEDLCYISDTIKKLIGKHNATQRQVEALYQEKNNVEEEKRLRIEARGDPELTIAIRRILGDR